VTYFALLESALVTHHMDVTTENQVCSQMNAVPTRSTSNVKPQDVHRRTGIRPPTKIQSLLSPPRTHGLAEMTDAATNARGAMGPPPVPTGSIKHKPSGRELVPFSTWTGR
jgi:hypothetical protein